MHLPTIKQLKYLCALAEHQHFGKAAKACYVSQSTLSSGISELEDNLGVVLFERNNKSVRVTAVGKTICERARSILTDTEDLVATASAAKEPFTTELRLGVIPTIAPFILPKMLSHVRRAHPQFKIFIREELSEHLVHELQAGELDILLLALPYPAEQVTTEHLFYDDFLLAYQDKHPIGKKAKLKTTDLINEDLLLLEDGHCIRDHALDACRMKAEELHIPYQATSLNTIIQMVANDMGITILPKMAVDTQMLKGTHVKTRPFDEEKIWRSVGLMWRKRTPREDEFRAFGDLILESLKVKPNKSVKL